MSDYSGYEAYRHSSVEARAATADPHQLVLMLVDGLLEELARATGHMEAKQMERKGQSIAKCMDILSGLDTALDMEKGGEMAEQLRQLYDFCGRHLFQASLKNDVAALAVVEQIIANLRDGWQAMAA